MDGPVDAADVPEAKAASVVMVREGAKEALEVRAVVARTQAAQRVGWRAKAVRVATKEVGAAASAVLAGMAAWEAPEATREVTRW